MNELRQLIEARHPGVNEAESVSYARGFARGMAVAGLRGEAAKLAMIAASIDDPLLEAGGSYLTLSMVESATSTSN